MKYYVTMGSGQQVEVHVSRRPAGRLEVRIGDRTIEVDAVDVDGAVNVKAGDRVFDLSVHEQSGQLQFVVDGQRVDAVVESERERVATSASRAGGSMGGEITAPMPGKVVKVLVGVGEMVEPGQAVVDFVLEDFSPAERSVMSEVAALGGSGIDLWLRFGTDSAMNRLNAGL